MRIHPALPVLLFAGALLAQTPCYDPNFGTNVGAGDDTVSTQTLGFTFPFNGGQVTSIGICSNGYIWLDNGTSTLADFSPTETELLAQGPRICARWCDLYPPASGSGGGVFFNSVPAGGGSPARAVITWDRVAFFANNAQFVTMQVILDSTGQINVLYDPLSDDAGVATIAGCTAGGNATANPVDLSALPLNPTTPTAYQVFPGSGPWDLNGQHMSWIANGSGYVVISNACNYATATNYGTGCVRQYTSFYENFAPASTFDLGNSSLSLFMTGSGYTAVGGAATFQAPSASAAALTLTDDGQVSVTLGSAMPYPGGSTTSLTVCSNGYVSVATGNGTAYAPNVTTMLGNPQTAWYSWHDFNPTIVGSGVVKFEEIGSVSYITWDGVWDYGGTSTGNASTWQLQFDRSTGTVSWAWTTMSSLGGTTNTGFLVGYSPGGASADPGPTDISVALPTTFPVGTSDIVPLALAATSRPAIGTTCNLVTSNIPAGSPFGATLLGFVQFNPGLSLAPFGMPGCFRYTDGAQTFLFLAPGASSTFPLVLPNNPAYVGVHVTCQSAVYTVPGLTPLGAIASNGVALSVGI